MHAQLREALRSRIREGVWSVGSCVPTERELCAEYRVSRITIREAVRALVQEGLLEPRRGLGTFVRAREGAALPLGARPMSIGLALYGFDQPDLKPETAPFYSALVAGIRTACQQFSHSISIVARQKSSLAIDNVEGGLVDGLILVNPRSRHEAEIERLQARRFPFVVVQPASGQTACNSVEYDMLDAVYRATMHLVGLRHRSIAYLGDPPDTRSGADGLRGYKLALLDAGLAFDGSLVGLGPEDQNPTTGPLDRLIEAGAQFSALVAADEIMTRRAAQHLREKGIEVPGAKALVGISSEPDPAGFLTTVVVPAREIGRRAAELLFDVVDGAVRFPVSIRVAPDLQVNRSCGSR